MKKYSLTCALALSVMSSAALAQPYLGMDAQTIPGTPPPPNAAPAMQIRALNAEKTAYVIVFRKGDEVVSGLTEFARRENIGNARISAIGAANEGSLGWLNQASTRYDNLLLTEPFEVLALTGNIARVNGQPTVHVHASISKKDGASMGGHVHRLVADPTLEVHVTAYPGELNKFLDDDSRMFLIDLQRSTTQSSASAS